MQQVKLERTGWRDMALSQRHRRWGWDCPAVDLDFLFLEYDNGKAVALVEYKNEHAAPQYATQPNYQAMIDLGNRANVPVFVCRYASNFCWYKVTPLNTMAKTWLKSQTLMNEQEWVTFLHKIRGYDLPQSLFDNDGVLI